MAIILLGSVLLHLKTLLHSL